MEETNQSYLKSFNDGYKLARYSPDLFEKLKPSLSPENEFDQAILDGAEQWQKEKEQQRVKELGELEKGNEQEQDIERD